MLWRVDVLGISHRFVDAETQGEAETFVRDQILGALDLQAQAADSHLTATYDQSGPIQRKRLLAAMDGLTSPRTRRDIGQARRQLNRIIRLDDEARQWADSHEPPTPPPVDPLMIDRLIKHAEVARIESNLSHLREWQRNDHLHGGN